MILVMNKNKQVQYKKKDTKETNKYHGLMSAMELTVSKSGGTI